MPNHAHATRKRHAAVVSAIDADTEAIRRESDVDAVRVVEIVERILALPKPEDDGSRLTMIDYSVRAWRSIGSAS